MFIFRWITTMLQRLRNRGNQPAQAAEPLPLPVAAHVPLPGVKARKLARDHAVSNYVGPALDEPGAAFIYEQIVAAVSQAYRSQGELREAHVRQERAGHELTELQRRSAEASAVADTADKGVDAQIARRANHIASQPVSPAAAKVRQADAEAANIESVVLEGLGALGDALLSTNLRPYVNRFNTIRRNEGLAELQALPADLVQQVVRAAVRPVLPIEA